MIDRISFNKKNPLFVDEDVVAALRYNDTVNALKAHVDPEDRGGV